MFNVASAKTRVSRLAAQASALAMRANSSSRSARIGRHGLRLTLAVSALLTTLLPTVPAWAAECTTKGAKVTYSVVYDAVAKADVVSGVKVSGLPIECAGRTLTVVLSKVGVSIYQFDVFLPPSSIPPLGESFFQFLLYEATRTTTDPIDSRSHILASNTDAANVYLSTLAP
jgi:hypothetical protein